MFLLSKVHRSMLLVSLRYVQSRIHMCSSILGSIFYVPSDTFQSAFIMLCWFFYVAECVILCWLVWCYILKCNVASFITLCSIFYVPSDKFSSALCYVASTMWQSALCYTGPSLVLHSKMKSSMPLIVVYHAMFSRPNVLF